MVLKFRQTLKPDKKFGMIYLWEALLILVILASIFIYAWQMNKLSPLIDKATAPLMSGNILQNAIIGPDAESAMQELKNKTIIFTAILAVFIILAWPFFKALSYDELCHKKLTGKQYLKFIIAELCWTALLVIIIYLLQLLMYKTLYESLPYSLLSRIVLFMAIIVAFIFISYLTITFFINMTRHDKVKEGLKAYYNTNIKGIRHFLKPLLYTFLVFIAVNIIIRIIELLPQIVSLVLISILALGYIVWLKIYYNICIEQKPVHEAKHKKK
jgi:hypothetical protein